MAGREGGRGREGVREGGREGGREGELTSHRPSPDLIHSLRGVDTSPPSSLSPSGASSAVSGSLLGYVSRPQRISPSSPHL